MSRFLRIGQKLTKIYLDGCNLEEFNIVVHTDGDLRGPGIMPATVEKSAKVLQKYIALLTDVTLPIILDNYAVHTEKEIAIGGVKRDYDTTREERYAEDEYEIKFVDGNLLINGGVRGILYGVYTFLEEYLGVRFLTATCERVLYQEEIHIPQTDKRFLSPFEYRELCHWNIFDADFSVKSKINGNFVRKLREEDGFGVGFAGGFAGLVHTFSLFCSPDKYFYEHPEYFALDEKGNRFPLALCYTNKDTERVVVSNIIEVLDKEIEPKLVSLSINDGVKSRCNCEKCKGLFHGKGNDTDRLLYFVNKVAKKIKKAYPEVKVDTISYADMLAPPEIVKPEDNVVIRVCASKGVSGLSLEDAANAKIAKAQDYIRRIQTLSEITDKIYVWDYPYDYVSVNAIFPILHTLREDMRFYVKHNVKGIYINGQTDGCDFDDLKIYLLAKVMFNPYMSAEEYERHLTEFLEAYYGDGWKEIYRFILMTERKSVKKTFNTHSYPQDVIPLRYDKDGNADYTFIDTSRALFDKAKKKARGGEWRRIDKNAVQIDYYEIHSLMQDGVKNGDAQTRTWWAQKNQELYYKLTKYGVKRVVENVFVPIVKNFAQSPIEWEYWDFQCLTGDRNNESYARELYLLIPVDAEEGTFVDVEFLYKTNNENDGGFVTLYGNGKEMYNPKWNEAGDFETLHFTQAQVLSKKTFAKVSGIDEKDLRINLLPIHLRGVILRVEKMDAGAYAFVREVKVISE